MKKGFTIVESLVSISILIAAVSGAMVAIQAGVTSYTSSKQQIVAFYLAQEAIEQMRNIRDSNIMSGRPWLGGINASGGDACFTGNACTVSPVESMMATRCPMVGLTPNCPNLRQDPVTGLYGYNAAWTLTNINRRVQIFTVSPNEITVRATVSWTRGILQREFVAQENLFNWR